MQLKTIFMNLVLMVTVSTEFYSGFGLSFTGI